MRTARRAWPIARCAWRATGSVCAAPRSGPTRTRVERAMPTPCSRRCAAISARGVSPRSTWRTRSSPSGRRIRRSCGSDGAWRATMRSRTGTAWRAIPRTMRCARMRDLSRSWHRRGCGSAAGRERVPLASCAGLRCWSLHERRGVRVDHLETPLHRNVAVRPRDLEAADIEMPNAADTVAVQLVVRAIGEVEEDLRAPFVGAHDHVLDRAADQVRKCRLQLAETHVMLPFTYNA